MSLAKAIAEVRAGHCERIAVPGVFRVWRDETGVHVEVMA